MWYHADRQVHCTWNAFLSWSYFFLVGRDAFHFKLDKQLASPCLEWLPPPVWDWDECWSPWWWNTAVHQCLKGLLRTRVWFLQTITLELPPVFSPPPPPVPLAVLHLDCCCSRWWRSAPPPASRLCILLSSLLACCCALSGLDCGLPGPDPPGPEVSWYWWEDVDVDGFPLEWRPGALPVPAAVVSVPPDRPAVW